MKEFRHIVIVSSLYLPHLGGVEQFTQSLAKSLAVECKVTVLCLNTESIPQDTRDGRLTVQYLPCYSMFCGRLPIPRPITGNLLRSFFQSNQVDFAIIQTRLYPLSFQAARILSEKKIPFILIEHGTGHIQFGKGFMNRLWKLYEHGITFGLKRYCKNYYGVSQASLDWLQHFGISGKGVIHNGVNPVDFQELQPFFREKYNIPSQAILIVFAGRIQKEKGILDLLQAFYQIDSDNVHLFIAGAGDMELMDSWRVNSHIHILGQISHSELLSLFAESQIFCLPTTYPEGLPTVILEAGFSGIPVITVDSGGIRDVIFDDITGLFVESGSPEQLRIKLELLIRNSSERQRLGSNLQNLIQKEFIWPEIIKNIKSLW